MPSANWKLSRNGMIMIHANPLRKLNILVNSSKLLFTILVSLAEKFILTFSHNRNTDRLKKKLEEYMQKYLSVSGPPTNFSLFPLFFFIIHSFYDKYV